MPLQSSGEISIADVVTFTRASASVVKPFSIGPVSTQRALSFYYNQAFVTASTFDATADPNPDQYILQTNTTNTNGSTLFNAIGNIFSLRLNNSSGLVVDNNDENQSFNASKEHTYTITNIPAGSYKVGARYSATQTAGGMQVTYGLRDLANNIFIFLDSAIAQSGELVIKDKLNTISLNNASNNIEIRHSTQFNGFSAGIANSILFVNIFRVS
jgi:hypothetical protein